MANNTSKTSEISLMDIVIQTLDECEIHFTRHESNGDTLVAQFSGDVASKTLFISVDEGKNFRVFVSAVHAPAHKRAEIAEYITRANWGLRFGCFEMDYSDGEIRYRYAVDVEDGVVSTEMVRSGIFLTLITYDRYLPGIFRVIYGNEAPAAVIDEIENESNDD
ncbi:MAG: YbjN domain-containing protein [Planctomycetia bacterium]|nr:YbjN domain-containing protein [Planctomycetia bacterium]